MRTLINSIVLLLFIQSLSAQEWTGTWSSTYGELRLVQKGNKVYGDYKDVGTIQGKVNGNTLTGIYTNQKTSGSKKGAIKWTLKNKTFTGKWGAINKTLTNKWDGKLINSNTPKLTSSIKNKVALQAVSMVNTNKIEFSTYTPKVLKYKQIQLKTKDDATLEIINNQFSNAIKITPKSNDGKKTTEKNKNCTTSYKKVDIGTSNFSFLSENGSPSYMLPGNMFRYTDVLDGSYTLIKEHRNPINLFIRDVRGQNVSTSITIKQPHSTSELNQAVTRLASYNYANVPANMSFEMTEISTVKELGFQLTGSYSNKAASIAAKVGLTTKNKQDSYYLLIKFQQSMYNISVDDNISEQIFKQKNVNTDDVVFISNITYGRKGFILIKTSKSLKDIKASLSVNYNGAVNKGGIDAAFNYLKKDTKAKVKLFMYGGDVNAAAKSIKDLMSDISNSKKSLSKYIETGAGNAMNALPIAYQLKNIKGEQLGLKTAFDVVTTTCVPKQKYKLKINLLLMKSYLSDDRDNRDDYCIQFTPELKIDGKTYQLKDKIFNSNKQKYNSQFTKGTNDLFVYNSEKNQLAIKEGNKEYINNSGVFYIPDNVRLSTADFKIKFRVWEASGKHSNGKPKLNRLIGNSKSGSFNYHSFNLAEILQVLTGVKTLGEGTDYKHCGSSKNCNQSKYGHNGKNKFYIGNDNTTPLANSGGNTKPVLITGEYMLNESKTRAAALNYTIELVK